MIDRIIQFRNIGQFADVYPPHDTEFKRFTLIYAANARGKTTFASILHSLANNDPQIMIERRRLGTQNPQRIELSHANVSLVFEEGEWSQNNLDISVFNDAFVAANICSGIEIDTEHRKNLHELIIGDTGVELSRRLQDLINRVEQHSSRLRVLADTIPANERGPYDVDEFCDLPQDPQVDAKIEEVLNRLAATNSAEVIHQRAGFQQISLPNFDIQHINDVLSRKLEDIEAAATDRVNAHLARLGVEGEDWVANGMQRIRSVSEGLGYEACPFCAQSLNRSDLIEHYRAYFSEEYKLLKTSIRQMEVDIQNAHAENISAEFERNIYTSEKTREFWKNFVDLPNIGINSTTIVHEWNIARDAVLTRLREKKVAPLEEMALSLEARRAINTYQDRVVEIVQLANSLTGFNDRLNQIRQRAEHDDPAVLSRRLERLQAHRTRFNAAVQERCNNFLEEKIAKANTEQQRNQVRDDLNRYRTEIFPEYENAVNNYLDRFGASFRLGDVQSVNRRHGSSASFCVVINQNNVNLNATEGPAFKNTLSAGDRSTLALAFFFASLDQDRNRENKIVVLDDPITSLDEHRALQTRTEIKNLALQVQQVIVLSHSKPFLCSLWEQADRQSSVTLQINRAENGSEITVWDVRTDSKSEHDKRHKLVRGYVRAADPDQARNVAQSLRPMLEAFLRVAYPKHFKPRTVIGRFLYKCHRKLGTDDEILSADDYSELDELKNYTNRFHHDGNPAWQPADINEPELTEFAQRVLRFTSRN